MSKIEDCGKALYDVSLSFMNKRVVVLFSRSFRELGEIEIFSERTKNDVAGRL